MAMENPTWFPYGWMCISRSLMTGGLFSGSITGIRHRPNTAGCFRALGYFRSLLFWQRTSTVCRNMKPESSGDRRGYDKASLLKTGALALALGVATWLLAPLLLPARLPEDFPKAPGMHALNPSLRELLQSADREARRKPG